MNIDDVFHKKYIIDCERLEKVLNIKCPSCGNTITKPCPQCGNLMSFSERCDFPWRNREYCSNCEEFLDCMKLNKDNKNEEKK